MIRCSDSIISCQYLVLIIEQSFRLESSCENFTSFEEKNTCIISQMLIFLDRISSRRSLVNKPALGESLMLGPNLEH